MRHKGAFTISEALIATAVFSLVLSLVFSITSVGRLSWAQFSGKLHLQQRAQVALTRMAQELMQSGTGHVFPDASGTGVTFSVYFEHEGVLLWGNGQDAGDIVYTISGTKLMRQLRSGSTILEEKTLVENLYIDSAQGEKGFTISPTTQSSAYSISLNLFIDTYQGARLAEPLIYRLSTIVSLRN